MRIPGNWRTGKMTVDNLLFVQFSKSIYHAEFCKKRVLMRVMKTIRKRLSTSGFALSDNHQISAQETP